jgi:hypothetical protein
MPLYKKEGINNYEMVFDVNNKEWKYTHKIMCNNFINERGKKVIHHKNFNKYDNTPENLQEMLWDDHVKLHSEFANPELLIKYSKSERGRNKSREIMCKNWNDENFRSKMKEINKNNGVKTSKILKEENRCGFQAFSKNKMKGMGRKNGLNNHIYLNTNNSHKKASNTWKERFEKDKKFRENVKKRSKKNLIEYNSRLKNGEIELTENQLTARKVNGKNINNKLTIEQRKLRGLKTAYTRWYQDKFDTFQEYLEFKEVEFNNHKVVSIEEIGYENVYDLTVDNYHNFAISSGIFVHNCAVGYDDNKKLVKFKNSWGKGWGDNGYGYIPYSYINDFLWDAWTCADLQVTREMLKETKSLYG